MTNAIRVTSLSSRDVLAVVWFLCVAAWTVPARADLPTASLDATREGERVRLDFSFNYYEDALSQCACRITRQAADGAEAVLHDGARERLSKSCSCPSSPWMPGEDAGSAGATAAADAGRAACPRQERCTETCAPFVDDPCDGDYTYTVDFYAVAQTAAASTQVAVDWSPSPCGGGGDDEPDCSVSASGGHAFVLFFMLVAGVLPLVLVRRRRARS